MAKRRSRGERRCFRCGKEFWHPGRRVCDECMEAWWAKRKAAFARAVGEIGPLASDTHEAIKARVAELEATHA